MPCTSDSAPPPNQPAKRWSSCRSLLRTLRILMERGEAEELVRRRRLTHAREKHRACDEDAFAYAYPLQLQLCISVEPFAYANGDVDPFMNEIDAPVRHDAS